jgi:hypothetical protein
LVEQKLIGDEEEKRIKPSTRVLIANSTQHAAVEDYSRVGIDRGAKNKQQQRQRRNTEILPLRQAQGQNDDVFDCSTTSAKRR